MAPTDSTDNPNPTSPKGDGAMGDENASTAVSHNEGGVSSVPKDGAEAERQRLEGAEQAQPQQPANDGD